MQVAQSTPMGRGLNPESAQHALLLRTCHCHCFASSQRTKSTGHTRVVAHTACCILLLSTHKAPTRQDRHQALTPCCPARTRTHAGPSNVDSTDQQATLTFLQVKQLLVLRS